MSGTIDKQFRPLVKLLRELGCTVEDPVGRSNHRQIHYEGKRVMSLPTSCSSRAAIHDAVRQLRRHGVPVPPGWPRRG